MIKLATSTECLEGLGISGYLVNMIKNYFRGRRVIIGASQMGLSQGVPQGFILGPLLWNILYDGVLRLELADGCNILAYADDLVLIVKANGKEELIHRA